MALCIIAARPALERAQAQARHQLSETELNAFFQTVAYGEAVLAQRWQRRILQRLSAEGGGIYFEGTPPFLQTVGEERALQESSGSEGGSSSVSQPSSAPPEPSEVVVSA